MNESIAALESGVALAPGAVELQVALGQLHLKRNDRSKARDVLLQVGAAAPERRDALIALAKVVFATVTTLVRLIFIGVPLALNPTTP